MEEKEQLFSIILLLENDQIDHNTRQVHVLKCQSFLPDQMPDTALTHMYISRLLEVQNVIRQFGKAVL